MASRLLSQRYCAVPRHHTTCTFEKLSLRAREIERQLHPSNAIRANTRFAIDVIDTTAIIVTTASQMRKALRVLDMLSAELTIMADPTPSLSGSPRKRKNYSAQHPQSSHAPRSRTKGLGASPCSRFPAKRSPPAN